jgi:hypothetical protein
MPILDYLKLIPHLFCLDTHQPLDTMSNPSFSESNVFADFNGTEAPEFKYVAPAPLVFKNKLVQDLYDHAKSKEVAVLKHTDTIKEALLPYITLVINDAAAYSEATTWSEFRGVSRQVETGEKEFDRMDPLTSMCFALWMNIYH